MTAEEKRLDRLQPLFRAVRGFWHTHADVTKDTPHVRDAINLRRIMAIVHFALLPCLVMALWNTGYQANMAMEQTGSPTAGWREGLFALFGTGHAPQSLSANMLHGALYFVPVYFTSLLAAFFWEALFAVVRRRQMSEGLSVTCALFALIVPPTLPLWQAALGISFGIVLGKEIFGGTGRNFLNPALAAYAFLFFAYPAQFTGDEVWIALDGVSSATPLALAAEEGMEGIAAVATWPQAFWGTLPGAMGEGCIPAIVFGALVLTGAGLASWRIILSVLAGAVGLSTLFFLIGSESNPMFQLSPLWHLVLGGLAFGAVFMATDPVSAPMTKAGQWLYGLLIGAMTILIRVFNPAFPEGIMLAILFGNVFAPVIDRYMLKAHIRKRRLRHGQ